MRRMSDPREDLPKTVAAVMVNAPSLVLRTGLALLRLKRRARKNAKSVLKGMLENGLPEDLARRLAQSYETDLSIRRLVGRLRRGPSRGNG